MPPVHLTNCVICMSLLNLHIRNTVDPLYLQIWILKDFGIKVIEKIIEIYFNLKKRILLLFAKETLTFLTFCMFLGKNIVLLSYFAVTFKYVLCSARAGMHGEKE